MSGRAWNLSLELMFRSFLFNPFTIATCIARPTSALTNLFVLTAIAKAAQGASITFVLALSFAAYLSMHPILLFPPLLLLCYDVRAQRSKVVSAWTFAIKHLLGLVVALGALLYVSALLTGSWEFLAATYGVRLLLPDLTPNVGLWWYFFTEMFDSFREFFLGVFWLHVASYVPGLTIRLRKQPLFVAVTLTGIFAVFQPYPSIADATLYLSLVPLYRHLFPCKLAFPQSCSQRANWNSDEVHFLGIIDNTLHILFRARILLSMDLCGLWKCQFLLRHHFSLESWPLHCRWRLTVCGIAGRIRCRKTRIAWQGGPTNLISIQ
jgi:hypothetical protein